MKHPIQLKDRAKLVAIGSDDEDKRPEIAEQRRASRYPSLLFPTTNHHSRIPAMRCVNCHNDLNGYPMVCPYCHTNPAHFGSQPYSGIDPDIVNAPCNDAGTLVVVLWVLGIFLLLLCPPLGLVIIGAGFALFFY